MHNRAFFGIFGPSYDMHVLVILKSFFFTVLSLMHLNYSMIHDMLQYSNTRYE